MKKLLLIFIIFSGNLSAQKVELPDSIKSQLLADTTVIITNYMWRTETKKQNQEGSYFTSFYNPHYIKERRDYITLHRIGYWRFFRKNGSIRRTVYIPFKSSNIETSTSFRKDGSIRNVQTLRNSETIRPAAKSDKGPIKCNYKMVTYYKNGNPKHSFRLFGTRHIGDYITYYENGQMKNKYTRNLDHKRDGKYLYWDEDGTLLCDGQYENGKKIGVWKVFDKDGNLKKEKNYKGNNR